MAQANASYSPQSATVIGILKDMYDTFAADLEKSNQDESNAQMGFEEVMAEKAEKNKMLAENEQLLEATQGQLKEDEEFFAAATESCKSKSAAWDERSRLRTEELSGIAKALEILTSDEAKATFKSATETRPVDTFGSDGVSFVQVAEEQDPAKKAYKVLQKVT